MLKTPITTGDLQRYLHGMQAAVPKIIHKAANRAAEMTVALLKAASIAHGLDPAGEYVNGWALDRARSELGRFLKAGTNGIAAVVVNRADHAVFVENGRKPGRPPPSVALIPWVGRVIGQVTGPDGRVISIPSMAFLVARAIGKRGIAPRPILARSLPMIHQLIAREVEISVTDALTGKSL